MIVPLENPAAIGEIAPRFWLPYVRARASWPSWLDITSSCPESYQTVFHDELYEATDFVLWRRCPLDRHGAAEWRRLRHLEHDGFVPWNHFFRAQVELELPALLMEIAL